MRILGFVFVALLVSFGIVGGDYYFSGTYLHEFLSDHFIETFGILVGLNIAGVIFLMGQILNLEASFDTRLSNIRMEIKHNTFFLLFSFAFSLLILVFRPDFINDTPFSSNLIFYLSNLSVIAIFILALFAIYEILSAVFLLGDKK